jgi:hypothetical protein
MIGQSLVANFEDLTGGLTGDLTGDLIKAWLR